ncbi:MAG: Bax inhibitor-1/YccA family protein [Bacteriovoracaceae bacterium]|nr:Bax inhibitor-1/YccA family protein [Bacteriovoracaceae bacterium]
MEEVLNRTMTDRVAAETARFMSGVYKWMCIGVLVTACVAFIVANSPSLFYAIAGNKMMFYGLIIAEIGVVMYLSAKINTMSAGKATMFFLLYSFLNGATLSVILMAYTGESVFNAFVLAASGFGGLSLFGYVTKRDLGPIGTFCHMAVWGLIAFSILSLFMPSIMGSTMGMLFNLAGIGIFAGLTAYDTQQIKQMQRAAHGSEMAHKQTIFGALKLYLDFINLFLFILRFVGGRRN